MDALTRPLARYERRGANDLDALRRHIRKGDVLLVEGEQRVSAVIRYMTQSCWSHAALYVGDELLLRDEHLREEALACFGDEASHLVIEALIDGVVASPLSKYAHLNIRLCRPHQLKPYDLAKVLDEAVRSLGWRYDLRNVVDLMRHLLPSVLLPRRLRPRSPRLGSGEPTQVICSSHVGQLFESVGFPVAPILEPAPADPPPSARGAGLRRWLPRRERLHERGVFRRRHPSLLTPRDFDLSPYFEVVKFNAIADGFDYQRIRWAEEREEQDG